jgi:BirA family biotin operon repressor/biotin-[acetyl-CoA-carboxylase] ligase
VILPPDEVWTLQTTAEPCRVFVFDELGSTNSTASELARTVSDPFAVVARFQSAGRGQYGRVWQARPGSSLLLSLAIHLPGQLARPVALTALTTVAVAETVYTLTGLQARIKWPNDLLVRGKKVCGVLIERTASTVIGVGLNLNQTPEDFAEAGLEGATSLGALTRRAFEIREVAECLLGRLFAELGRLQAGEQVALEADWKWRVGLLGRPVVVDCHDGSRSAGRLREMGFDGIELDIPGGSTIRIIPESIRHIRPAEPLPHSTETPHPPPQE